MSCDKHVQLVWSHWHAWVVAVSPQTAAATGVQLSVNNCGILLPHLLQRLHAVSSHGTEMEAAITAASAHPQWFTQHEKCLQTSHPRSTVKSGGTQGRKESGGCSQGYDFLLEEIYYVQVKVKPFFSWIIKSITLGSFIQSSVWNPQIRSAEWQRSKELCKLLA